MEKEQEELVMLSVDALRLQLVHQMFLPEDN
jgi:hypothetical protein